MTIAGSVDNGEVDVEYSPDPNQHILVEVDDKGVAHVVSTPNDKRLDKHDKRIRHMEEAIANVAIGILEMRKGAEAQDKRITSLELQVHRLLNPEPFSDEWLEAPEYLKGYADGTAAVTRTEGDYAHVPGPEWQTMTEELESLRYARPTYHCPCGWFGTPDGIKHMVGSQYPFCPHCGNLVTPVLAADILDMAAELEQLRSAMKDMSYSDGVLDGAEAAHDAMAPAIDEMQEELESLRSTRPVMDERGVLLSHDAYDMLERQAAKWRNVPWLSLLVTSGRNKAMTDEQIYMAKEASRMWLANNAPKEAAE